MSGLDARPGRRTEQGPDILDGSFLRDLDYQVLALFVNISKNSNSVHYIFFNAQ